MTLQAGDKLMSPTDVSEMLGIPVHTLYRWRYKGDGPTGYRVGRHVRYRREAVEAWLERRPTPVSAAQASVPERPARHRPTVEPARPEGILSTSPLRSRVLRPMSISAGGVVSDEPHSKASRSQIPRALARP
jgi:excisionase family DNA binding protein